MFKAVFLSCVLMLCGCATMYTADTRESPSTRWAEVSGDYRVRAGSPINVYLRSVDGQVLTFWQHAAYVDAGSHQLLVDCSVSTTQKWSRHELKVSLRAGVRYSLRAEGNPHQGCTQVVLDEVN